jgi:hypothetical protein
MIGRPWLVVAGVLVVAASASAGLYRWFEQTSDPLPRVSFEEPGWQLHVARRMPEDVSALLVQYDPELETTRVVVGTAPMGGVYWFNPQLPESTITVAQGLGDSMQFGTCCVSDLAVHDLDRDGTPELLAETCQIEPLGQPRLYVWTMSGRLLPRGMVRPAVQSSWSHGLGFVRGTTGTRVFSTFCGYGEIVEYKLMKQTDGGFSAEAVAWKQVGRLPASGEGTQAVDADSDGDTDLCLATGFQEGGAAIHVYDLSSDPSLTTPFRIDEAGRFGNVKFLAGSLREGEPCELLTWWCEGRAGGYGEMIRYRLGRNGVEDRRVLAQDDSNQVWPIDGQMSLVDSDGDGCREAWFVTTSGRVWRYDATRGPRVTPICHIAGPMGPIAGDTRFDAGGMRLYLGCGDLVLALEPDRDGGRK